MPPIKIHPPIIDAIVTCLKPILEEGTVADKDVGLFLKQHKHFGARDRSMIAESVYDIVRWRLKYMHQLEHAHPHLTYYKHLLLVSLLNRNYDISNPEIFGVTQEDITTLRKTISMPIADPSIAQSYPGDFYYYCEQQMGESWHSLAAALNKVPSVFIRANTLKTSAEQLLVLLEQEHIQASITNSDSLPAALRTPTCLQILSKNNLKNSALYKQGLFEFQDMGSQAIGMFVQQLLPHKALSALKILDLCAGAGGKTLHLSALLQNKGKIYATDYSAARLKHLQQRALQAGCQNIEIIDFKDAQTLRQLDVILIDAPCSGTGTFKRQADLKYKVTPEKIAEYQTIQANLLESYKHLPDKGGSIIYATCSILPQENQLQVEHFLKRNHTFTLRESYQLMPTHYNGDGFFMANICRL